MKKYVAGLMFSENAGSLALVVKNKPNWQKGLLNGIGGKIEESDFELGSIYTDSQKAMSREFNEETGVNTEPKDWNLFLQMKSNNGNSNADATNGKTQQYNEGWSVDFYRTFTDKVFNVQTNEEESIVVRNICDLLSLNTIDNLKWIILLALDKNPKITNSIY